MWKIEKLKSLSQLIMNIIDTFFKKENSFSLIGEEKTYLDLAENAPYIIIYY